MINLNDSHAFEDASLTPASSNLFNRNTYVIEYELIKLKTKPLTTKLANTTVHDRKVASRRLFSRWFIL